MEENKNLETQNEVSEQVEKIQEEVVKKGKGFLAKNKVWIIILAILFFAGSYLMGVYNNLITLNEGVENKWSQVDNQYQRRMDLVSQLVSSVRAGMQQEQEIFGKIAEARTHYAGAGSISEKMAAGQEMTSALSRLLLVMENYPNLKSSDTVKQLMVQIEGTENRISVARKDFNDEVKNYNLVIKRFPTSILANMFGFDAKNYFKAAEGADKTPEMDFGFKEK